jgi:hypothetical protein
MRSRQIMIMMTNSSVKLAWILVVIVSIFLPTAALPTNQGVYAQDSPSTTNATVLSDNNASSQSGLQINLLAILMDLRIPSIS